MVSWKEITFLYFISIYWSFCIASPISQPDGQPLRDAGVNQPSHSSTAEKNQPCAVDVLFVLDGSSSVKDDFSIMRDTVLNISSLLNVGPYTHRVALLEFSGESRIWPKYPFGFAQTTAEFVETIRNMPFIQGTTLAGRALSVARSMLEERRRDVQTVVLVITDGFSQDDLAQQAADIQRLEHVVMFALEIPEAYNMETLIQIAGNASRVIVRPNIVEKARQLLSPWLNCLFPLVKPVTHIVNTTTSTTTTTTTTTTAPTTPFSSGCELDLVLVLDTSSSVVDQFGEYRELAAQIIDNLNIGAYFTRVALVQYASQWRVQIPFHLNSSFSKKQLLEATRNAYFTGGTTNTAAGLTQAMAEMTDTNLGARPGTARRVVVVFTDGFSQHDPKQAADELRKHGVTIYVIAEQLATFEPNFEELWSIADDKQHVWIQSDLPKVIDQLSKLSNSNCRPSPPSVELEKEKTESTKAPFH